MATVHIFGGEKGGVGKSFVCRAAIQYLIDEGIEFSLFDADRSNPDIKRIYSQMKCDEVVFSENEKHEDTANAIYEAATSKQTLVNLPAQVFVPFTEWFKKNELLEIAKSDGVAFTHWFVCDGGYDSLKLFKRSLGYFKAGIGHILVKNWGKCDDWEPLEKDGELQSLMARLGVKVIDFPKFIGNADRNTIDARSLTFGKAREYEEFGSISRQRVKKFLREAEQAFEQVGVFEQQAGSEKITSEVASEQRKDEENGKAPVTASGVGFDPKHQTDKQLNQNSNQASPNSQAQNSDKNGGAAAK